MAPTNRPLPVRFAPLAADDLEVAFAYVDDRDRAAALSLLGKLEDATCRLGEFPEMGAPLSADQFEFIAPGVRFVAVEPYTLFYRSHADAIVVLRILHSRRDALGALFE